MTMQGGTIDIERIHNLELAYERIAADVKANSTKLDALAEALYRVSEAQSQLSQTQTQMRLVLERMDERMKNMEARQDRLDTHMDRLETRMDRLEARLEKLMYWVVGLLTAIGLAVVGIMIRALFFPI